MEITYRFWEKNQGLEEFQAKIYNHNNPGPNPVTAQDIISRFEREKIDPRTVMYAFGPENKPLAYIQARDYPEIKETHIGYPWKLDDCPERVQDKLFDDMLSYLKARDQAKEYKIQIAVGTDQQDIMNFIQGKGLVIKDKAYRYDIDIRKVSESSLPEGDYVTRVATEDDIPLLVELLKKDGRFSNQFPTDESCIEYFKDRVFKVGHVILVFKGSELVMASAPLIYKFPEDDVERLILRFHSFLQQIHEAAIEPLIIALAKECVTHDYGVDKPLSVFIGPGETIFAEKCSQWNPSKVETAVIFGL